MDLKQRNIYFNMFIKVENIDTKTSQSQKREPL